MCAGAIDGCFIPMRKPAGEFGFRYWCYKNFCSIILLGCVDARGVFIYVDVGSPGSVGDAAAFHACPLKEKLVSGFALPASLGRIIEGVSVQPYIIGDAAFPLLPYLLKGFEGDPARDTKEYAFNYSLIRCRRVVESAYGRLKGRWWVLRKGNMTDPNFLSAVTLVCCALHNICEQRGVLFDDSTREEEAEATASAAVTSTDAGSRAIRDALAKHVVTVGRGGLQMLLR